MSLPLLFSPLFAELVAGDPLVVVDAGARDGLSWPWSELRDDVVRVVAFEPDVHECERLNRSAPPNVEFLPYALWNGEGEVRLHVAAVPSCSSVHPPDMCLLKRFDAVHRVPRETQRKTVARTSTLDWILKERGLVCDFLKIDTQGAELEILHGGAATLEASLAVLVETWTLPVHTGQGRVGAVLEELARHSLDPFDVGIAAAWARRGAGALPFAGRRQIVGLDILALRDPEGGSVHFSTTRVAKVAAIADAFGHIGAAASFLAGDDHLHALRGELLERSRRLAGRSPLARLRRRRARTAVLHE